MPNPENPRYHHGNLRAGLIDAALARLAEQSAETLSLRQLAAMAGVSIAAVYRHFPSKDALLAEVAVDGFNRLVEVWERELPPPGKTGAEERFQQLGELYIDFALGSPAHYRLMFGQVGLRSFPVLQQAAERCFGYVLAAARDAVGEAGADERWSLPAASAAWSLVHGYVMLSLGGLLVRYGAQPALTPAMVPRFLQLPKEALPG
jgi:AcrR family transcriptional regulator